MSNSHDTEMRQMIVDTATRMFRDLCEPKVVNALEEENIWPAELWTTLEESGLTHIAVPEEKGGAGGTLGDAMAVLSVAAAHSAPLPLAETMMAGVALSSAGINVPPGPLALVMATDGSAINFTAEGEGWRLTGDARGVAYAQHAGHYVIVGEGDGRPMAALVPAAEVQPDPGNNIAGEPAGNLSLNGCNVPGGKAGPLGNNLDMAGLHRLGALARSVMMAGAMENVLETTVQYTLDRVQFGRPIAKFQAVQQSLAVIAGEVAAAKTAADVAVKSVEESGTLADEAAMIASAKARTSEAAGKVAELAHQAHGAIGFTFEHNLHHRTRRLWAWRDEFGSEFYWQGEIGRRIAKGGADSLWSFITGT